jgi:hypothetical protein
MRSLVIMIISLLTVAAPVHAQTYSKGEFEGHLRLIMEWWPGEYDNHEQIVRKPGGGISEHVYEPIFRIHSHYIKLDLPELGENVFYVEESLSNDPANFMRREITFR